MSGLKVTKQLPETCNQMGLSKGEPVSQLPDRVVKTSGGLETWIWSYTPTLPALRP